MDAVKLMGEIVLETAKASADQDSLGCAKLVVFCNAPDDNPVSYTHLVGHLVMEPGRECYEPIIRLFGKEIIKEDKTIDRRRVSDVVFSQKEKLDAVNKIVHPAVRRYILETLEKERVSGRKLCVVEAALLLEEPVSYTHLDVYKRQVYNRLLCTGIYSANV